jgi:hypothetical protein
LRRFDPEQRPALEGYGFGRVNATAAFFACFEGE